MINAKESFIEELKCEVNQWLGNYFCGKDDFNKELYDSMEYSINIGGKRIRPILMLLAYNMFKNDYKTIMPIACALEMIHTYSLIHDDLPCMDNDDLRRGKPTNHKVFGEAMAVLAGDGLLNEAMNIMFNYCNINHDAISACKTISEAAGSEGMVGGQVVDILSEEKKISLEELQYMHDKKTGELIRCALVSGAMLANAEEHYVKKLYEYGTKLGLAFQIKDDILDVIGDEKLLGKNTNKDMENMKTTFVTIHGVDNCNKMCEELTQECLSILDSIDRNTDHLKSITLCLLNRIN